MLFNSKNKFNRMLISLTLLFIPTAYALDDDPDAIANIMTLYPVTSPNETIAAPVAFGAETGDVFGSFSFSTADITDSGETSSISAGFGLGDPDKALGLTTVLSITTTPGPFHTGGLSFQLSHNFNSLTALAAGVQNVLPWGSNNVYAQSYYAVGTRQFNFYPAPHHKLPIVLSLGVGNNELGNATLDVQSSTISPFVSLGVQITPEVTFIAESVAHTFNTGVSFTPLPKKPFVVTLIGSNLTRYSDSYASFTATFAYAGSI